MCHHEHKKLFMMLKTNYGKIYILIYINEKEFNILKIYNLEIYMQFRLCMHEYFDLITNLSK
jgi:hypothetical protein